MSQTPHPHDPFGTEPGTPAEQAAPTSDPALHPHDPYASAPDTAGAPTQPAAGDPAPQPLHGAAPDTAAPYDAAPYDAAPAIAPGGQSGYQVPGASHGVHGGIPGGMPGGHQGGAPGVEQPDQPAPGTKGVFEGALPGQPMSRSDSRLWGMFSQLAVVLGHIVSWGFLGWVGPLIIFLIYKDRDRFVRFHSAEALNGAIAVFLAQIVLTIAISIFGVVTLGFGWALFPLVGLPALLQLVFSIIGAVKANQGEYWSYPFNIRLVK